MESKNSAKEFICIRTNFKSNQWSISIGTGKQMNEIYRTGNPEIDTKYISEFSF